MAEYFDDIGWLDTYGTYVDKMWSHNVIYYVRDYYQREIHRAHAEGRDASDAIQCYDALNSDILESERCRDGQTTRNGTHQK